MNTKRIIFFIVVIGFSFLQLSAQSRTVRKAQKNADRVEKREEKAFQKSQKRGKKRHYEMQAASTKKQMKETAKRSKIHNKKRKRTSFFSQCGKKRRLKKNLR